MEKRWDILGLGAVAVDDILYLERFPRPDEKMPVQATRRQGGGLTATALVAAARHGARSAYCARLGDDDLSQYSLGELEREGVDVATVQRTPRARPYHSVILVDAPSASRVILYNTAGVEEPDDEFVSEEMVAAARSVLIEVANLLGAYRDQLVVVGGWVPELLLPGGHVGSTDVDLALDHRHLDEGSYRTIREQLLGRGYRQGRIGRSGSAKRSS